MASLDLNPIHSKLIGSSPSYVKALEKAAFNRKEGSMALVDELNQELNSFLVESGRKFELFIAEVDYLSFLSGDGEEYVEAVENESKDLCYVVSADTGLNVIGNKIKLSVDWFDVKHMLIHNDSFFTLEMLDGAQISMSNVFLSDIMRELFLALNNEPSTESQIPVFKEIFS
jgi:hypothetical protein